MGLERPKFPVVSVAGTNGKGSSVAMLARALSEGGYRVGAYFSPWLLRFTEVATVNGQPLTDRQWAAGFDAVEQGRLGDPLTPFEFQTLAVMAMFSRAAVDLAVLEVGLGGARDAVNMFDADYALLTSISVDHTDWLGSTRESIGREKAGILRPGQLAVVGDPSPPISVVQRADEVGARLHCRGADFDLVRPGGTGPWHWRGPDGREFELDPRRVDPSTSQRDNMAAVLMLLELTDRRFPCSGRNRVAAICGHHMPGRQQRLPGADGYPERWLDVGHNVDAAHSLAEVLNQQPPEGRTRAVLSMLRDKDAAGFVTAMAGTIDVWYLATNPDSRGQTGADLARRCGQAISNEVHIHDSIAQAYRHAMRASGPGDRVVALGSFACVRAVMSVEALGQREYSK